MSRYERLVSRPVCVPDLPKTRSVRVFRNFGYTGPVCVGSVGVGVGIGCAERRGERLGLVVGGGRALLAWIGYGLRRFRRGSPYNHPPSRKASPRCLGCEGNGAERDGTEGHGADAAWGSWVASVEFRDPFWGVVDMFCVLPGVSLCPVAFPFD